MNKNKLNYYIDFLLLIIFIVNIVTAFNRPWIGIHKATGNLIIILVAIHLLLHWRWMTYMTKNIFKGEFK